MVKREIVKSDEFVDWLDEKSRNIVEDFLSGYKKKDVYSSAIRILLYHEIVKDDVTDLTFDDYRKVIPLNKIIIKEKLSSQERYKNRFFQYLYAYDYLKDPSGFDSIMHKQQLIREFSKEKKENIKNQNEKKTVNALTVEEIMAIQNVIDIDSTKLDTLKMQFCWFALFDLGLPIEEVRKSITSENYFNNKITTSEGVFDIPTKYHRLFHELSNRDGNYNGFATLDAIIANLGKVTKLSRKLKPNMIKNTRKSTLITCGNCFREYNNESKYWTSINNRIVCIECAESIKKKLNFDVEQRDIKNINIDTSSTQETSLLFTYNDLKTKLKNKKVDYLKLHQFQMEIGKLGEAFAYEVECKNLKDTKYLQLIDQSKADDPSNGYDILSFNQDGLPLHIEVKATVGKEEKFHLTENERNTALRMKEQGLTYVIYFIKEVMSDTPQLEIIKDITSNKNYVFTTKTWEISKKYNV